MSLESNYYGITDANQTYTKRQIQNHMIIVKQKFAPEERMDENVHHLSHIWNHIYICIWMYFITQYLDGIQNSVPEYVQQVDGIISISCICFMSVTDQIDFYCVEYDGSDECLLKRCASQNINNITNRSFQCQVRHQPKATRFMIRNARYQLLIQTPMPWQHPWCDSQSCEN